MTTSRGAGHQALSRRLGLTDAVGIGLASMLGAGVFVVFAPAAARAGSLLLLTVVLAGALAVVNATSTARLAIRYPRAGGAYVYGRERLGMPWGHLAGWAFISGKIASCAAMALTIGVHVLPGWSKAVAILVVLVVLALNLQGIERPARVARAITLAVLVVVLTFVVVLLMSPPVTADAPPPTPPGSGGWWGVAQAAGFMFFAFAGYARVATLGEEVVEPRRTIPRAVAICLGVVLGLYVLITVALGRTLGAGWVAAREAPLAEAAEISAWPWLGPMLRIAAVLAAGGALLALTLGVSRTVLAMARDRHLPPVLARLEGPHRVPRRAEIVVAGFVIVMIVLVDLRGVIGFSSFCVLVYYAIANASAWTLDDGWLGRAVAAVGFIGCLLVAALLPWESVLAGAVVLAIGAFIGWVRHTTRE